MNPNDRTQGDGPVRCSAWLGLPPVKLESRWKEILGENAEAMPEDVRRRRWDDWLNLAGKGQREIWTDTNGCEDCIHLDGYWCKLQGLPCTVNPILTMRHGMIGMACMGAGKESPNDQAHAPVNNTEQSK